MPPSPSAVALVIRNPILPGFRPDPVICRVGQDYYIANSSFQWWPGVPISHSRDLVNWELVSYALTRTSQLDMDRHPDSGGIWAPCLTWNESEGLFYLIYTNVNRHSRYSPIETPNYLVTAPDVRGPWSEPVYLNQSGFDPSLYHGDDGRAWLVNMLMDGRPGRRNFFAGIVLQEYSKQERKLVGPITNIFPGTKLDATEGPHLFKRRQYYYLLVAEGGTGYHHAMTLARSRSITGPYEVHPGNPIMTAWGTELPIQKCGHGSLVETPDGQWYGVFLCGRPNQEKRCVLGRETAIERGSWHDDGWFYFDSPHPRQEVPAPNQSPAPSSSSALSQSAVPVAPPAAPVRDDFDSSELALPWINLRGPLGRAMSLADRPGHLRLYGAPYPIETDRVQALVARRLEHRDFAAETCLEYRPGNIFQFAGLTCFYGHVSYYWLRVGWDEAAGTVVELVKRLGDQLTLAGRMPADWGRYHLRVTARDDQYQFAASPDGRNWTDVGPAQDGSILSDEASAQFGFAFTGTTVGMACVDLAETRLPADFDWFDYRGL